MGNSTPIYLSIGGNQGNRQQFLEDAAQLLTKVVGPLLEASSIYETAAWGKTDQAPFLNQVLKMETTHSPDRLLKLCLKVEASLGRIREERWGPRPIDIDILFYGNAVIDHDFLQIPHPRLAMRNFVLIPLKEIAKDLIHPVLNKSIETLYEISPDTLAVTLKA